MRVADLLDHLQRFPPEMEVRVYLEPDWFPDDVDLNNIPGHYRIGWLRVEDVSGSVLVLHLDDEQSPAFGGLVAGRKRRSARKRG